MYLFCTMQHLHWYHYLQYCIVLHRTVLVLYATQQSHMACTVKDDAVLKKVLVKPVWVLHRTEQVCEVRCSTHMVLVVYDAVQYSRAYGTSTMKYDTVLKYCPAGTASYGIHLTCSHEKNIVHQKQQNHMMQNKATRQPQDQLSQTHNHQTLTNNNSEGNREGWRM